MSGTKTVVLALVSALAGGGVAALLASRGRPDAHLASAANSQATGEREPQAVDLSGLDSRLRQLEARTAIPSAPPPSAAQTGAGQGQQPGSPSPEEYARRLQDEMRARIAQVAAEPSDATWSQATAKVLRDEFEELAPRAKFKVADLECKTTSCLAKLAWDSYPEAAQNWGAILHSHSAKNCAKTVYVPPPEPDQTGSSYEGTVLLDCTQDRVQ
jgi:hypothetical protein